MKVYEKTLEKRLRDIVKIDEKQFGFQTGKSTVVNYEFFCITTVAGKVCSKEETAFPCLCQKAWFGYAKRGDANNIIRRAMDLEVEGRRPVGRPKKTWSKVVEKDTRKLNIIEDMTEDKKQWRQLILRPTPGVGNQEQ